MAAMSPANNVELRGPGTQRVYVCSKMAGEGSGAVTGQLYKQDLATLVSPSLLNTNLVHTL
jgi:hypothetical protein